jgi:hypothetical protein
MAGTINRRRINRCRGGIALAALLSIASTAASAEESIFAFTYTTDLLPQGPGGRAMGDVATPEKRRDL